MNSRKTTWTLAEIEQYSKAYITPEMVADVLDANPQTIRDTAALNPDKLGFPVIRVGKYYRFPRDAFVFFMKYGYRPIKIEASVSNLLNKTEALHE